MAEVNKETFNTSREELGIPEDPGEKELKAVVKNRATIKKKSPMTKFIETFLGGRPDDVGRGIVMDVIIPAMKDMFYDTFMEGLRRVLYSDGKPSPSTYARRNVIHVDHKDYGSYYGKSSVSRRATIRSGHFDFDDILFETRTDAESVLEGLIDVLDQTGAVTVYDLYTLAGVKDRSWTAQEWGWTNLAHSSIERIRGGYVLNLPEPEDIRQ